MDKEPGNIRVVVLAGTPRERGRIHGETLRPGIRTHIECWRDLIAERAAMPADDYIALLCEETNFIPAIERWTPDLLDEVRGIAEGAGISFREAYAYDIVDEEWVFSRDADSV